MQISVESRKPIFSGEEIIFSVILILVAIWEIIANLFDSVVAKKIKDEKCFLWRKVSLSASN